MSASPDSNIAFQELQPDLILSCVESLGYQTDGRLLALNSYENRVYRVGLEGGAPLVAKFYRPGRWDEDAILEEHAISIELAEEEIPVVAPLLHDGRSLHEYGNFRFAVYPCRGGRAPDLDDTALQRQIGRFVARIHLVGETKTYLHRPRLDVATYGEASRDFLLQAGFIPDALESAYASLCDHLFEAIHACYARAGDVRILRIHADFHPSNVLVLDEQLHIVDFDDTRMGPAVQDLWMFLSGDRNEQTPQLNEMLAGYTEFRHFDARELNLIEALRTLRIMHYAAWLGRRWQDPEFHVTFPWFDTPRYWDDHVLALREQAGLMQEEPLVWDNDRYM
jgi:Ser/Thr protein kinase RdoA (MazF antagonist)